MSGGTDNHLLLLDTMSLGITGKEAETALDEVNITLNKNAIPYDTLKPNITSGVRIGTAAMTTKGYKEKEFVQVGKMIAKVLKNKDDENIKNEVKEEVRKLTEAFPFE